MSEFKIRAEDPPPFQVSLCNALLQRATPIMKGKPGVWFLLAEYDLGRTMTTVVSDLRVRAGKDFTFSARTVKGDGTKVHRIYGKYNVVKKTK